jgi:hypothetical protein
MCADKIHALLSQQAGHILTVVDICFTRCAGEAVQAAASKEIIDRVVVIITISRKTRAIVEAGVFMAGI